MKAYLFSIVLLVGCGYAEKDDKTEPPVELPDIPDPDEIDFDADVQPLFVRSCHPCHAGADPQSGLGLDSETTVRKNLQKAINRIAAGTMPPDTSGKKPINAREAKIIVDWANQ